MLSALSSSSSGIAVSIHFARSETRLFMVAGACIAQQVINVAPGMPNAIPQRETRFTLGELQNELSEVEPVVSEFHKLTQRWHL
jgi:hypothetical protein